MTSAAGCLPRHAFCLARGFGRRKGVEAWQRRSRCRKSSALGSKMTNGPMIPGAGRPSLFVIYHRSLVICHFGELATLPRPWAPFSPSSPPFPCYSATSALVRRAQIQARIAPRRREVSKAEEFFAQNQVFPLDKIQEPQNALSRPIGRRFWNQGLSGFGGSGSERRREAGADDGRASGHCRARRAMTPAQGNDAAGGRCRTRSLERSKMISGENCIPRA